MQPKLAIRSAILVCALATAAPSFAVDPLTKESPILYRSDSMSIERLSELKARGVKTIISVRRHKLPKIEQEATRLGMRYVQIPTGAFKEPGKAEIAAFLDVLCKKQNQPACVFCWGGRDRSSFYVAVSRIAMENWTAEQALAEMKEKKVRFWWPGASDYPEILKENAPMMRQIASQNGARLY